MLKAASKKEYICALISNKKTNAIEMQLREFGIYDYFSVIWGADLLVEPKPAAINIKNLLNILQFNTSETIIIGDTYVDIHMAKNAGVDSCAVLWGFSTNEQLKKENPTYLVSQPKEILQIISV